MKLTYREIHWQARALLFFGECKTQLQRSLKPYVDRGELNVPSEAFECAYRCGYEISDMHQKVAEGIYDFIGENGDGCRDNTLEELISIAKGNKAKGGEK